MATSDRISELFTAIESSNVKQVKQLLTLGISLEQKNSEGQTPLTLAASIGKFEIIDSLIAAGAKVNLEKESLAFDSHISSISSPHRDELSELITLATEDAPEAVKNFYSGLLSVIDALSKNTSDEELDREDLASTLLKAAVLAGEIDSDRSEALKSS